MRRAACRVLLAVLLVLLVAPSAAAQPLTFDVRPDPAKAGPGDVAEWTITVHNPSDEPRNVTFSTSRGVRGAGGGFADEALTVPANGSATTRFRVKVPDSGGIISNIGKTVQVRLDATDQATGATETLTLRVELTAPSVQAQALPSHPLSLVAIVAMVGALAYGYMQELSPTLVIAATILGLFFVQLIAEPDAIAGAIDPVMQELSLRPYLFVRGGQWWAPVTHMFMHGGLMHVIGNLIILVLVGPRLESHMGDRTYVALYFLAGLGAAAATVALFHDDVPMGLIPNVGASGAIYGVLAAFAMRLPKERIPIPIGIMIFIPAYLAFPMYVAYNIFLSFGQTNTAWWAHLAGAAVGAVFAFFWEPKEPETQPWEADWPAGG